MRSLIPIALICTILCIIMNSCNAEPPTTTENPEYLIETVRYISRARRAAQENGGGVGGCAGAGAGAEMGFGFGVNMDAQGGGQADG